MRFISVFLVCFLLLAPFTRSIVKDRDKPVIILALDNSGSIALSADSSYYRQSFAGDIRELYDKLNGLAEVRLYAFGESTVAVSNEELKGTLDYSGRFTDISGLLVQLRDLYENRNVGALVLASDGIYNTGSSPLYHFKGWAAPVYSIALGDTTARMDQVIVKVNFNRLVYLDNQFPIEVVVNANGMQGKASSFRVLHNGNILHSRDFQISGEDFTQAYAVVLDARTTGIQKYVIELESLEGELSFVNNRREIFIEVLDAKNKVLMLSAAPHPDISAIKQAMESNRNYEVEHWLYGEFMGNLEDFNMVILHQLPASGTSADGILNAIREKQVPALHILGPQSDIPRFNQRRTGLNLVAGKPVFEEAVPFFNRSFNAFSLNEETISWISGLPPLVVPLGDYQVSNASRVIMFQRIGQVETSRPLIMLTESLEGRTGVITGEGIWKWRMYNFARHNHHLYFNDLINKMVQYLSLKEQKRKFRVYHSVNFLENMAVTFEAEVYDDNFELNNEADVEMTIQDEAGKQFPYTFNKTGNAYRLNAGRFQPGNYSYTARVSAGNLQHAANGQFSVSPIDLEALSLVADHHLMSQLARENGGKMYYPGQLDALADDLLKREDIRPVIYARKKYDDLLNKPWLIALIIGLLSLEWFLRKRGGSY